MPICEWMGDWKTGSNKSTIYFHYLTWSLFACVDVCNVNTRVQCEYKSMEKSVWLIWCLQSYILLHISIRLKFNLISDRKDSSTAPWNIFLICCPIHCFSIFLDLAYNIYTESIYMWRAQITITQFKLSFMRYSVNFNLLILNKHFPH